MEPSMDTITVNPRHRAAVNEGPPENPFSCNICKKSYTRIDHLARHYRSHSRERPFACKVCSKTFARVDLLKRHAAKHDSTDDASDGVLPSTKRRKTLPDINRPRAQRACQACADAKSRCEGDRPCFRCQQKSIACDYPPSRSNGSLDHSEAHQIGNSQGHDGQAVANSLMSSEQQGVEQTTVVPDIADSSRADVIDSLDQMDVQGGSLQLSTPSKPVSGGLSSKKSYEHDMMAHFEAYPSFDFLQDAPSAVNRPNSVEGLMNDEASLIDILDFGVDLVFDTPSALDMDFPFAFNERMLQPLGNSRDTEMNINMNRSGIATPGLRSKLNITASAQAFKESLWLWTPEKDDHGALEQNNLSLPCESTVMEDQVPTESIPAHQQVSHMIRGKVLAMVLQTCGHAIFPHVVSNFPGTDPLTRLVHNFISFHSRSEMPWIHVATIEVEKECPEFLASMMCYGAAISPEPTIRKLGFAIQEALRIANHAQFERNNQHTRELRPLQTFALQLDVGLWSGDRRKMEISESHSMPLITMIRRAGHFRGEKLAIITPQREDIGEALEVKWRSWAQQESFKRLALYLFYRDTRSSMSLLSQPLISYAEVATAPPCHKNLWEARTALEWKTIHLTQFQDEDKTAYVRRTFLDDSTNLFRHQHTIDVDTSILLFTATVWPQMWQYREMVTSTKFSETRNARHGSLVMSSKRQELAQILEHIRMNAREWRVDMKPAAWLLHEQCSMHLCVSLEDVQILAGKEGEEEARRNFPTMSAWAKSSEARQALFHAGQTLRAARDHQKFMLRDASAIAVYHASLVFWAYAVLSKSDLASPLDAFSIEDGGPGSLDFVRLDGVEGPEVRRFLMLGRGIPCIHDQIQNGDTSVREVPLSEPAEVMRTMTYVLQKQHEGGEKSGPPLLENLSKLMHSLGKAYLARRH